MSGTTALMRQMQVSQENIKNANDPNATRKVAVVSTKHINNQTFAKYEGVRRGFEDGGISAEQLLNTITKALSADAAYSLISESGVDAFINPQKPTSLNNRFNNLIKQTEALKLDNSSEAKGKLTKSLSDLLDGVNGLKDTLSKTQQTGINLIKNKLHDFNGKLEQLHQINQQIIRTPEGQKANYYDRRDELIRDISEATNITVSYSSNGAAIIDCGNASLVSESGFSRLAFSPNANLSEGVGEFYVVSQRNKQGNQRTNVTDSIKGGAIGGIGGVIINDIPKMQQEIARYEQNIKLVVNDAFFKAANVDINFKSQEQLSRSSTLQGSTTISIIGADGLPAAVDPVAGNAEATGNYFRNFEIKQGETLQNAIKRFNQQFSLDPTQPRAPVGDIGDVKAIFRADGSIDFAINNMSNYDTKLQIMDIRSHAAWGGGVAPASDPVVFAAGWNNVDMNFSSTDVKPGEIITTQGLKNGGAVADGEIISVKLRAISSDGKIEWREMQFQKPPAGFGGQDQYIRASDIFDDAGALLVGGGIDAHGRTIQNGNPVASMKLVDENGITIPENAPDQKGYLVIESYGGKKLAMQDKPQDKGEAQGLASMLRFKEVIVNKDGKLELNEAIKTNPNLLPTNSMVESNKTQLNKNVGNGNRAATNIYFNFNAGGNLWVGDFIRFTINGKVIDVNMSGGEQDEDDVLQLLQAKPELKDILEFTANNANTSIEIRAKNLGQDFNHIRVDFKLDSNFIYQSSAKVDAGAVIPVAATFMPDSTAGGGAAAAGNTLQNGTDQIQVVDVNPHTHYLGTSNSLFESLISSLENSSSNIQGLSFADGENSFSVKGGLIAITNNIANTGTQKKQELEIAKKELEIKGQIHSEKYRIDTPTEMMNSQQISFSILAGAKIKALHLELMKQLVNIA